MKHLLLNFFLGSPPAPPPVPVRREVYVQRFLTVCRLLARIKFETIELSVSEEIRPDGAVVIYANHPSFWDPVVCALICRAILPSHKVFAPIDSDALRTHWYFNGLGFFGVEQGTGRGMRRFLRVGEAILQNLELPSLVLTPEGRFTDPGDRPLVLRSGLSALLNRLTDRAPSVYPLALQYQPTKSGKLAVWASLGCRVPVVAGERSRLHTLLERSLEDALDRNAERMRTGHRGTNILEEKI